MLNAAAHHWVRTPTLLPSLADTDVGPRRITFYREKVIWGAKSEGKARRMKAKEALSIDKSLKNKTLCRMNIISMRRFELRQQL